MQVTLQKNLYTTKSEILVQTLEDLCNRSCLKQWMISTATFNDVTIKESVMWELCTENVRMRRVIFHHGQLI